MNSLRLTVKRQSYPRIRKYGPIEHRFSICLIHKGSIINVGVTKQSLRRKIEIKIKKQSIFGRNPLKWNCLVTINGEPTIDKEPKKELFENREFSYLKFFTIIFSVNIIKIFFLQIKMILIKTLNYHLFSIFITNQQIKKVTLIIRF